MLRLVTSEAFRSNAKNFWKSNYVRYKPYAPYLIFLGYSVVGAYILHILEQKLPPVADARTPGLKHCFREGGYNAALFFIISTCSTIGFGSVLACNWYTKVLSVVFSLIGIPLILYILSDLGHRMSRYATDAYVIIYSAYRRRYPLPRVRQPPPRNTSFWPRSVTVYVEDPLPKHFVQPDSGASTPKHAPSESSIAFSTPTTVEDDDEFYADEIVDVPVWIGIGLFLICLSLCTAFYYQTECYFLWEAIYYSLLTFVSGDFTTKHYEWSIPIYIIIFAGFSTMTMTANIVQNNLQNMLTRVKRDVAREILKQQEAAAEGGKDDGISPQEILNEILKKEGLSWMIPTDETDKLDKLAEEAGRKRIAATQTPHDPDPPKKVRLPRYAVCVPKRNERASLARLEKFAKKSNTEELKYASKDGQAGDGLIPARWSKISGDDDLIYKPLADEVSETPLQFDVKDVSTMKTLEYVDQKLHTDNLIKYCTFSLQFDGADAREMGIQIDEEDVEFLISTGQEIPETPEPTPKAEKRRFSLSAVAKLAAQKQMEDKSKSKFAKLAWKIARQAGERSLSTIPENLAPQGAGSRRGSTAAALERKAANKVEEGKKKSKEKKVTFTKKTK